AAKAKRIFETFDTVEQTAGLTVAEAYEKRQRHLRVAKADRKIRQAEASSPQRAVISTWPQFSEMITAEVERRLEEAELLTASEATKALAEVTRAAAALRHLEEQLQQRSVVNTGEESP